MKTLAASVIFVLLGIAAVTWITGGFTLLTTEQARRIEIFNRRPALPDVRLINQTGQTQRFPDWVKAQNTYLIVDFIYTNCQSLCRTLGSEFQQLQHQIIERGLQNRVHLLSISFDPEHDNYTVLGQYAQHLQANPNIWSFATVAQKSDLQALLQTFGVTVIADQFGGFQHNAALIWVSPSGQLRRVTDYNSNDPLQLLTELASEN